MRKHLFFLFFITLSYSSNAQQTVSKVETHKCGINSEFIRSCSDPASISKLTATYKSASRSSSITCGRFNLVFEDVILGNGIGFDDPITGIAFQNCACDVMNYIQSVFYIPTGDGSPIEILMNQSWNATTNPLPGTFDPSTLATGGPLYSSSSYVAGTSGFYGGNMYDHFITGNDPDPSAIDGQITFNFDQPYRVCSAPQACYYYDFYSVFLHEVGHTMGWGSSLKEDSSLFPESSFGSNRYTMYDKYFVYFGNILTGPMMHVVDTSLASAPVINPFIPSAALTSSQIWLSKEVADDAAGNQNNPLYSNVAGAPNSISHFSDYQSSFGDVSANAPGFLVNYVMGLYFWPNQLKSDFSLQELRAFNTMGYTFLPSFLSSSSINPSVSNVAVLTNHHPYTTKAIIGYNWLYSGPYSMGELDDNAYTPNEYTTDNCTPVTINLGADSRLNDADGDVIRIAPGSLFNIRGCGNGNNHNRLTVTNAPGGDIITYTPRANFLGRAQFGFQLYDGKEPGAFMIYTIDVTGCNACDSNIVVNGNFEEGMEVATQTYLLTENSVIHHYRDGMYYSGFNHILADGMVYNNAGIGIVRASNFCDDIRGAFGFAQHSFSPGGAPAVSFATHGDRYFNISSQNNYFRLCSSPQNCSQYVLEFDYFSTADYTAIIGFTDNPVSSSTIISLNNDTSFLFSNTSGSWQHGSITFDFCAANAAFIDISGPYGVSTVLLDNINLHLVATPIFSNTLSATATSVISGTNVILFSNPLNPTCDLTYLWQPGGNTSANYAIVPTTTNTYTLTISNGCATITDSVTINVITGINDISTLENITIFPNPGSGMFFLDIELLQKTDLVLTIENVLGQIIYQKTILGTIGKQSESIDIKNEADGMYILKVKTAGAVISKKILKE